MTGREAVAGARRRFARRGRSTVPWPRAASSPCPCLRPRRSTKQTPRGWRHGSIDCCVRPWPRRRSRLSKAASDPALGTHSIRIVGRPSRSPAVRVAGRPRAWQSPSLWWVVVMEETASRGWSPTRLRGASALVRRRPARLEGPVAGAALPGAQGRPPGASRHPPPPRQRRTGWLPCQRHARTGDPADRGPMAGHFLYSLTPRPQRSRRPAPSVASHPRPNSRPAV